MIEFEVIQELKPYTEILEIIKDYTHETKNGKVKHLSVLQHITIPSRK